LFAVVFELLVGVVAGKLRLHTGYCK